MLLTEGISDVCLVINHEAKISKHHKWRSSDRKIVRLRRFISVFSPVVHRRAVFFLYINNIEGCGECKQLTGQTLLILLVVYTKFGNRELFQASKLLKLLSVKISRSLFLLFLFLRFDFYCILNTD